MESNNGSVIRKMYGYTHIPQSQAELFEALNSGPLYRYINVHRPGYFPKTSTDEKGKQKKIDRYEDMMTPYEKFRSLACPSQYLKSGITFKKRDAFASEITDNEAAVQRFNQLHERLKTGT